jgi:predicted RNase H-like nuclease (RuvC/YqgF family)
MLTLFIIISLLLLAICIGLFATRGSSVKIIDKLHNEITDLNRDKKGLELEVNRLKGLNTTLENNLNVTTQDKAGYKAKCERYETRLNSMVDNSDEVIRLNKLCDTQGKQIIDLKRSNANKDKSIAKLRGRHK